MCPDCKRPIAECRCSAGPDVRTRPEIDGVVRVRPERKGRGGKTATVISGVPGDHAALEKIAKKLKKSCGAGGSVKDWEIIIQGDKVDDCVAILEKMGMNAKRAGG